MSKLLSELRKANIRGSIEPSEAKLFGEAKPSFTMLVKIHSSDNMYAFERHFHLMKKQTLDGMLAQVLKGQ